MRSVRLRQKQRGLGYIYPIARFTTNALTIRGKPDWITYCRIVSSLLCITLPILHHTAEQVAQITVHYLDSAFVIEHAY